MVALSFGTPAPACLAYNRTLRLKCVWIRARCVIRPSPPPLDAINRTRASVRRSITVRALTLRKGYVDRFAGTSKLDGGPCPSPALSISGARGRTSGARCTVPGGPRSGSGLFRRSMGKFVDSSLSDRSRTCGGGSRGLVHVVWPLEGLSDVTSWAKHGSSGSGMPGRNRNSGCPSFPAAPK
jgi:hypothetical protein